MDYNHKLWERKQKKKQYEKFEKSRIKKRYFKEIEKMEEEAEVKPVEVNPLEEKSKEFYNQLFSKDQPEVKLSRRKQKRLEKLQTDLDLGRLEGDEKAKAEEDIEWLKGLQRQKAKDLEEKRAHEAQQENEAKPKIKDAKTFNHHLEKKLQNKNEQEKLDRQKQREEYQRKVNKKLKERTRKARLLTKKTKKGQPVMKNLLGNLLTKIGGQE